MTELTVSHQPPRCGYCSHRNYLLSCAEYDSLVAGHEARCAICRRSGPETGHGFLCIDHDPFTGQWAVRGLLCSSCNGRLSIDRAWSPEAAAYLADPWYRRRFTELGLSLECPPEPPVGSITDKGGHRWRRTRRGWECQSRIGPRGAFTWDGLHRRYRPAAID